MSIHTMEEVLAWIEELNKNIHVNIQRTDLTHCAPWYYDREQGEIRNADRSFFQIRGVQEIGEEGNTAAHPIIIQDEIGYLGIICKRFDDEMHYLMQAKIEPGNINKIQISPTIQATKSNFTQKHFGKRPAYLDYFINAAKYRIVVDQLQSEQSSRFWGKRNRNIIIEINEDIVILPSHMWMTLKQIKWLMHLNNFVNMDTRAVLSCLPIEKNQFEISDIALLRSVHGSRDYLPEIYHYINNYKMFNEIKRRFVPLHSLNNWKMSNGEFVCKDPYSFKVIFCNIEIEGREVRHWCQPLFEAVGSATFGLLTRVNHGIREFLIRAIPEIGCFDKIELGPSVQREYIHDKSQNTVVDDLFDAHLRTGEGIKFNTLLSEEGGRFYHEQNRNVIIEVDVDELSILPKDYFWTDYKTLGLLLKINNCLNIQLRNLLSVLEW